MNVVTKLLIISFMITIPISLYANGFTEVAVPLITAGANLLRGANASKELKKVISEKDILASDLATAKIEIAVFQEKDRNTNIRIENAVLHATAEAQRTCTGLEQKLTAAQKKEAEDAAKLDKAVKIAVFTGVVSTIYVAKSVYDWARPETPDEKSWREYSNNQAETRDKSARRALNFIKTEKEFRVCIMDHAKKTKRADGIPMACSASADEYVKYLEVEEWSKIKTDYNEHIRG